MFNRFLAAAVALSLCLPSPGLAQIYGNADSVRNLPVHQIGPNRGGMIGLSVDTKLYSCGSTTCLKVIGFSGTNFSNLRIGDYIVQVNNVYFRSVDDFFGLIRENAPGAVVRLDYWEGDNGLRASYQSAALLGTQNSSYTSLDSMLPQLEKIVRADARHWQISTYRNNTLRNLRVASVSSDGRTYVIRGTYNYGGFWSNYQDSVDFRYAGSDLSCIEYGHEPGCRALLREDRSVLGPALAIAGVIAVGFIATRSRSSSGSGGSGGGYRGETRYQCEQRCNSYPGDSNANAEAAYIAQCRRGCSSLPNY